MFADTNNNGNLDAGEASTTTNADGSFTLTGASGPLVMRGGTDVSTGLPFEGELTAPAGSTVITPLTTLVLQLAPTMEGNTLEEKLAAAQDAVALAFGLNTNIDLQTFDPVPLAISGDATAIKILSAAIQVQSTITQISAVTGSDSDVITAIIEAIANGGTVNLTQATVVEGIATAAGVDTEAAITVVADVVAAANKSIQDATNVPDPAPGDVVTNLAKAGKVAQGETADALAATDFDVLDDVQHLTDTYTGGSLTVLVNNAQVGDPENVQIGTLGDDTLSGSPNADTIDGLNGRDTIDGGAGDDLLYGGMSYDTLTGGAGDDRLDGGSELDRAIYTDAIGPITVNLAAGTVIGTGVGTDTLVSVEQFRGSANADIYAASGYTGVSPLGSLPAAHNEFEGMAGDDTITGNGSTAVAYLNAKQGVTVDLTIWSGPGLGASGTAHSTAAGDLAEIGTDTFTGGVQGIRGSEFDDVLKGSNNFANVEFFQGRGGDDLIDGGGGFDRVFYWWRTDDNLTSGVDIKLAAGTVVALNLPSGAVDHVGADTLRSIEGVRGTNFADKYDATGFTITNIPNPLANFGDAGFITIGGLQRAYNEFEGLGGDDFITGNGNTRIQYINATDGVTVDLDSPTNGVPGSTGIAYGTAAGDLANVGTDTIFGGVNAIQGSYYNDTLYGSNNGSSSSQVFDGGAGDDTIDGRGGFDQADYNGALGTSGIDVTVTTKTVAGDAFHVVGDASIGTDTLIDIE